jgi:small-conductance mechanosensitive channel
MNAFDWQSSLTETYAAFSQQVIAYFPQIIGAALLLLAGFAVAHLMRLTSYKLANSLDSLLQRSVKVESAQRENIRRSYANILSKTVYWAVMLFFIAAAANLLGWKLFSEWMNNLLEYLPKLVTGLLIILVGFLLSSGGKAAVRSAAEAAGAASGVLLGALAQAVILFTAVVIGVQNIGIDVTFLTTLMIVIVAVVLAGGVMAFGLGSKTLVANIIGAQHTRKHCRVGEHMSIGDVQGTISEVSQSVIILDTENGRVVVPAKLFLEQSSTLRNID